MKEKRTGSLILIGGHEDKKPDGRRVILREVAQAAQEQGGRLVIVTVATQEPEQLAEEYTALFRELGVARTEVLDIRTRDHALDDELVSKLSGAPAVFFTGGDQLRITSQIGDSHVFRCMRRIHQEGGTIVGTSAGAAAMPETMLVSGAGRESFEIDAVGMAAGLGFLPGVVIDSHFAQRGRIGRLLGAVAQNPMNLGLGIDEDTAVVVRGGESFHVIGSGAVYVVDGAGITYSSLSEEQPEGIVTIHDARLHVLGAGESFDLTRRRPTPRAPA